MNARQNPPITGLDRLWQVGAAMISSCRTGQPPVLDHNHPLRKALSRHTAFVAQRPALFIVMSVAVGTAFSYLFTLLYALGPSGTTGLLSRGPGDWTTSALRPVERDGAVAADIEMRQAWIYGSSMRALDKDVLEEGLKGQNMLLGHSLGCIGPGSSVGSAGVGAPGEGESGSRMVFHSPLIYWNCTSSALLADPDVISTISRQSRSLSPFNVTLNPSSVFGATRKTFDGTIAAADALVITLLYPHGSKHVEDVWSRGARALAKTGRYDTFPDHGKSIAPPMTSTLYEFCSQHAPTRANSFALVLAYGVIAVCVLSHWGKIRELKSRLGLAVAVVTQISVSILAASTIVPFLDNHNDMRRLGDPRIPREAYPFVVLVVGLENTFRLINAVVQTPQEDSPTSRIAKAVGNIGYVTLTAVAQNLLLLYLLPKIIASPDVADLCVFATVAIIFDLIFHLTFFIAVVSLDLRRLGPRDSLDWNVGISGEPSKRRTEGATLNGNAEAVKPRRGHGPSLLSSAFRVRTAGTIAIVCFLMALDRHFASKEIPFPEKRLVEQIPSAGTTSSTAAFMETVLQAEGPAAWLESQDSDTIKELAQAMGLTSHRFVGYVHDPLIFVSKGANRTPPPRDHSNQPLFSSLGPQLLVHHHRRLILYITLASAITGLLVNYLLHDEAGDETNDAFDARKPQIMVQTLGRGHIVDIDMLTASGKGALASVGLDRRILVWHLKGGQQTAESVPSVLPSTNNNNKRLWPVTAIALDDQAEWLAICTKAGSISFWNISSKQFGKSAQVKCGPSEEPVSFFFMPRSPSDGGAGNARLILVRRSGLMTEVEVSGKPDAVLAAVEHQISPAGTVPISSSQPLHSSRMPLRLVSTTRGGHMYVTSKRRGRAWVSERISWPKAMLATEIQDMEFVPVKAMGMMGLVRSSASSDVHLLDIQLTAVICRFRLHTPKPSTLRTIHSPRQPCRSCGASAVASFSIAYTEHESGEFVMHTFTPNATQLERGYLICLRAERDVREKRCAGFEKVSEKVLRTDVSGGAWEGTLFNSVAGIRKCLIPSPRNRSRGGLSGGTHYPSNLGSYGMVKRKNSGSSQQLRTSPHSEEEEDEWVAWTMPSTGGVVTCPLSRAPDEATGSTDLLVTRAGPVCPIGKKSVAVAFGATIKVVMLGTELYDDVGDDDGGPQPAAGRRPLATRKTYGARPVG